MMLVNLFMRFYEIDDGIIIFDGVDIFVVFCVELCFWFGMVLQDIWLFSGIIYDNIVYGCFEVFEEDIFNVVWVVYVDYFVYILFDGYDIIIDDDGFNVLVG